MATSQYENLPQMAELSIKSNSDVISKYTDRAYLLHRQDLKLAKNEALGLHDKNIICGPKYLMEGRPDRKRNSQVQILNSNIVTIDDLISGDIPCGKFFICRIISPCTKLISIDGVVEDAEGKKAIRISVYNATPYLRLKLQVGAILAIKNPWFKTTRKGGLTLCVDDPSDIIHDVTILNKLNVEWKGEIPAKYCNLKMVASSNDDYKKLGNTEFVKKDYTKSRHFYSEGLAKFPDDINLLSNRAATFLHLRLFSLALSDAELVLSMQENHSKAIFRKAKALCGLGKYAEAQSFITEKINNAKEDKIQLEGLGELEKLKSHVEKLINQSKTGEFDIIELLKNRHVEYLEVAEYKSDIKISPIEGKGRGIVACRKFSSGELILASRAFEIAFREYTIDGLSNPGLDSQSDEFFSKIVQRLLDEPGKIENVYDLWAGPNFAPVTTGEADIDVKRLRAICLQNPFTFRLTPTKEIVGLWILPAFLNHSCMDYNARWQIFGDMIFVRAVNSIDKGEEIVVPYSTFEDFETKNSFFRDMSFRCTCKLCQAEDAVGESVLKRADQIVNEGLKHWTVKEVLSAIQELEEGTGNNKLLNMVHEKLYFRLACVYNNLENYQDFFKVLKKLYDDVEHIHYKVALLINIYNLIDDGNVCSGFSLKKCKQELENILEILVGSSNASKLMAISLNKLAEIPL